MGVTKGSYILTDAPLSGVSPEEMLNWMKDNDDEQGLATALALVHGEVDWIDDELYDYEEGSQEYDTAYNTYRKWREIEESIYSRIMEILKAENDAGESHHQIENKGLHYIVKPFMERNGYIDGAGWWVKETGTATNIQEWRWCLVGNIVKTHEFGETHEIKFGTKQFSAGTKVYMAPIHWGDGYENIIVIGKPRRGYQYIEIIMRSKYIENLCLQKVFKPAVLKRMDNSEWTWWGNQDTDRDEIIQYLESRNPKEAKKAKLKAVAVDFQIKSK